MRAQFCAELQQLYRKCSINFRKRFEKFGKENEMSIDDIYRAGEMIPEVEGTRPWGNPEEKGPHVSQRSQNHLYSY